MAVRSLTLILSLEGEPANAPRIADGGRAHGAWMEFFEDVLLWNLTILADTFSNISTLVFSNITLRTGSLLSAVCAFPLLRRLELDRFCVSTLFETFLTLKPIPFLSALSLPAETDPTKTGLGKYLFHIGDALHILRLEFESSLLERDNLVITLTPCTGLRRLDLVFQEDCDLDMAITALHVLSCLRSRDLAIVNQLDRRHRRNMTPSWRRLDTKLAEEQFAGL
ncbi:hypothetical protein B0H14DRAFT_3435096 [Mycena olivaceomarginata]|nr:hypothetical protein B0H14DRAFT_3435096 [Mycena olivaceomarginata]